LHPNYFIPDKSVLNDLKINPGDKFTILRFVSWQAYHDVGHKGISLDNKIKAVKEFNKYGKVIITSEEKLPKELEQYQATIEPHKMHDAIFYASLLMGESATMASEAAMLGTPAIYLDNDGRGYTDELEKKYGLVFNYTESFEDQLKAIYKGIEILNEDKVIYNKRREVLLSEKESLTDFMLKNLL
jgi:predicted glycosyltransferase